MAGAARGGLEEPRLSREVRGLGPSPTMAVNELCDELARRGRPVYRLGLGQSPFPVPSAVVEALRANAWRKDYLPVRGLGALRDAVADYHRRRHAVACDGGDILIGPGSKELMFLLQVVYDGELVVPTPAWVSYAPQARILGRPVRLVAMEAEDGWRMPPALLDELGRTDPRPRVVILNYPSNPTGTSYDPAELAALAAVARHHQMILLSDEIYGELHYQGRHVSAARFYPEGTIISSGLSKWCGAGGWRLGTFTFPRPLRWLLEAMAAVASESFTATSAPVQHAAVHAFVGGPALERYLDDARRVLAALSGWSRARLEAAGARMAHPVGGFYLFPDLESHAAVLRARGVRTSRELCRRLLEETGVAVLPGADFGRPEEELTLRLALVDFDGARALAAAAARPGELDEPFLRASCAPVVAAVEALAAWLEAAAEVNASSACRDASGGAPTPGAAPGSSCAPGACDPP